MEIIPTDIWPVSLVLEKRHSDHPWLEHEWVACGVSLEAAAGDDWVRLHQAPGLSRYLSACYDIELHRTETESYVYNLESPAPSLFIVLREAEGPADAEVPFEIHLITPSPYEAQDYLDSSEEHVDRIALTAELQARLQAFVIEHHKEQDFKKRRRDKLDVEDYKFGQEPLVELRKRGKEPDE